MRHEGSFVSETFISVQDANKKWSIRIFTSRRQKLFLRFCVSNPQMMSTKNFDAQFSFHFWSVVKSPSEQTRL